MLHRIVGVYVMIALVATTDTGSAQLKKLRAGITVGELKSVGSAKNKRDIEIEVLTPGEEKPRRYTVNPQQKDVHTALKETKVGDRVEIDWYDTVEGLCVHTLRPVQSIRTGDAKPVKPKVAVFAGGADEDLQVLRETLGKLAGVTFKADEIQFGDFKRDGGLFTSFFTIEIKDLSTTDIGAIAKAVASANTSKKAQAPPALFLVLKYRPDSIKNEPFRAALAKVKGIHPAKSWAGDNYLWVSVDGTGAGRLAEITRSLHDAGIRFRDPITDSGD